MPSAMERINALEKLVHELHVLVAPPGSKIIFWTSQNISYEAATNMRKLAEDFGIRALVVGNVDGVVIQTQEQESDRG